jgi:integrase
LRAVKARVRPSTYRGYEQQVRTNIRPLVGPVPLARLTPSDVEAMQASLVEAGRAARTARTARIILSAALADAVRDGAIPRNVARLARPPRVERPDLAVLTASDVQALLAATTDDNDGPLYAVAVASGLRQGELLGLTWDDVDTDAGQLTVRRALALDEHGTYSLRPPKTARSRRTISLPEFGLQALRRQQRRVKELQLAAGSAWQDREGLVFPDPIGRPLSGTAVTKDFAAALRRAKLPHIRFHDLRHTFATLAISRGASLRAVADALGHSSITVTADTYAHVTPELRREVASALDGVLAGGRAS